MISTTHEAIGEEESTGTGYLSGRKTVLILTMNADYRTVGPAAHKCLNPSKLTLCHTRLRPTEIIYQFPLSITAVDIKHN